ncbi:alanyl-tRNA editing protein [uncultured Lentibacter sp.]|uniref:alanyl-tRNA editing protein n=1 Tax=uncultured Lentibacter sp. TaxID=1659309 RepID=UPI0026354354|nr:alanyl-tRNA editing protein [uncultured Lentibacter sp.]
MSGLESAALYLQDAYLRDSPATVLGHTAEGGVVLDQSVFYPTGGGQPGDSGQISWDGKTLDIATAVKGAGSEIVLVPAAPEALPDVGVKLHQSLDWDRRHRHMRVHTALHLLSVVLALPVTGGQIAEHKGRLDFLMPDPLEDREAVELALNRLVDLDLPVTQAWISEDELAAQPELVKTMSVAPPRGRGKIRLVAIGEGSSRVDLQPCGGTHVARTAEIGAVRLGKVESKGKQNRRVNLHLV